MRSVFALWCLTVAVGFGLFTGVTSSQRRNETNKRFCTLDTTLVTFLVNGIKSVTLSQASAAPTLYERAYSSGVALAAELADEAPCDVHYVKPTNILEH